MADKATPKANRALGIFCSLVPHGHGDTEDPMMMDFIRALLCGGSTQETRKQNTRTRYHWRCPCGSHSRGGDLFESDAEYNAQRHQLSKGVVKGVRHPMPEVFSTEEEFE